MAFAHGTNPWASQIRCAVSTMSSKELGNGRFILSKGTITRTTLVSPRLYPSAVIAITQEKKSLGIDTSLVRIGKSALA